MKSVYLLYVQYSDEKKGYYRTQLDSVHEDLLTIDKRVIEVTKDSLFRDYKVEVMPLVEDPLKIK